MKVGIISDTHSKTDLAKEAIDTLLKEDIEYLLHAGDIEKRETLELIKNSNIPYYCVFGNNDFHLQSLQNEYNIKKEPYYFKIDNISFKLMHLPFFMTPDSDIIISGHTHEFESNFINRKLFLNPGECCARNKPYSEYAILEIDTKEYRVRRFSKDIINNKLYKELYTYKRIENG